MAIPKTTSLRPGLPSRLDEILAAPLARKPIDRPTRPAILLRQLIELSYESSIMATAMDVAEAVASVLPPKPIEGRGQQLDEVIRKQLGAAERERSVARRTAVTDGRPPSTETFDRIDHSTGMIRKIGQDGISQLEEIDPIDPTAVAAPRAKRVSESMTASSADSGLHKLLNARMDPDRRTEPGGPPTGAVPKSDATANAPKKSITMTAVGQPSRVGWIALAVVLLAAGGFGAWKLLGKPDDVASNPPDEHRTDVASGTLEIDPSPEGATGYIADSKGVIAKKFGPTTHKNPVRLAVEAGKPFHVHIELEGYEPVDQERTINANETHVIAPELRKAKASLKVTTNPEGAQVSLKGKLLGETPLVRNDLDATKGELVIAKTGFESFKQRIELRAGKTVEIDQTLKQGPKFGTIRILFPKGGWADAYYKGTRLGQAPADVLRLPVGKQKIQLVNTGKVPALKWIVTCEVSETEQKDCKTQLP
jgi:hypothetical protein